VEYFRDFDLFGRTAEITGFLLFYFFPDFVLAFENSKKIFFFFCIEACKHYLILKTKPRKVTLAAKTTKKMVKFLFFRFFPDFIFF
jgi:hypothetical protein